MTILSPEVMDTIREAKRQFKEQYAHLFVPGGINGIGIGTGFDASGKMGLNVAVESSQEILDQIPDEFMGQIVHKQIIGKIQAF
jgi:hypothetical protein